ncbi:MAG TPA: COR domain-containing protein, partial [Saprospiraceae bacterium]|nr:COR domain-containing protein [Saprospiraceae bacterium]
MNVLDLSVNNINDVSPLSNLNKLITLELYDNKISDISSLKNFYSLRYLDLSYNNIVDFSHLKYLIQEGKQLLLTNDSPNDRILIKNNPIDDTLTLAIEKGNEAILEYFEKYEIERKKGSRPINEAKLIIIGEPESGKTTLMNYLQGKPFTVPSTTQGFTIERWIVKGNQTNYRINIWDFGGQDIQSTVHQFFLTQDTLYLMVLNARKDELPDKYIEQIKSYAPDSPIIIVVNRIEENPSYEMGVKRLQETHKDKDGNSLIKGVFKVSLLKGHKELNPSYFPILENMRQAIQKELLEMPHIHRPVPVTYLAVKEYLESAFFADKPYISHDTYEAICREKGLDAQSDNDLLGYLNNLGTVRYFDDLSLRNLQILNPEWLSDGVYRILVSERTKQLRGIITEKDFETIL